jgi:hypothetical protein
MLPNRFEPKKTNRWVLAIEGIDSYIVKSASRPKVSIEEKEIPYINSYRYIAGNAKFETMTIELHDPIAPSGAQQVMEWIRLHAETVSGRAGYADFYKRDIQIKMLDPVGTVIELWDIKGAQIKEATFGDLKYDNQDPLGINLVIRFDNCVLQF